MHNELFVPSLKFSFFLIHIYVGLSGYQAAGCQKDIAFKKPI